MTVSMDAFGNSDFSKQKFSESAVRYFAMKYYEEVQETEDKRPCASIREDLKACLLATDCVRLHRKTPRECLLSNDPSVPDECLALRTTFFECKRSLMDNRQRFRGRKGY